MQETMTVRLTTRSGQSPQPVEIPARVGSVRLGQLIGEGGGGAVFSGYDEALGRKVAVKVLHRQLGQMSQAAQHELIVGVRSAARIKHPNIVTVHAVEMVSGMPVIVMEFVDGLSLRDMLRRSGALEPTLGLHVMRSITSAIATLHEAGVIHRDLKPANILFDHDGVGHVCDFGLACNYETGSFGEQVETVVGSPLYMAPEVFDGHVSPQADVYALGIMAFEVLAGRPPFCADTIPEMRRLHEQQEPAWHLLERRGISEATIEVLQRALRKAKMMRYKTAGHLLRACQRCEPNPPSPDRMQTELARIVLARQAPDTRPRSAAADAQAMTTFDLLAERARQKREQRWNQSPSGFGPE